MTKVLISIFLLLSLAIPAEALEIEAPKVPSSSAQKMPENTESLSEGLLELMEKAIRAVRPDLTEAVKVSIQVIASAMMVSLLRTFTGSVKNTADLVGTIMVAAVLMRSADSMVRLGTHTIRELNDYGKLLYPVMAAALAAQGGVTASTALYAGTAIFDTILGTLISCLLLPMVYLFLALSTANSAIGEDILKKLCDIVKNALNWCLKTILMVFTTYMSITGVVSGTTDAAALKATKITISSVVPVVGGVLSDASEAVLVSAGLLKNAAGIYGILAILAVFLEPFLRIGIHYLLLKVTASVCGMFASKRMAGMVDDFSAAMGLLLAMTGSVCLLLLISTVCFMKGVG